LQDIENQLLQHQARPPHLQNHSAQHELIYRHQNILAKQEIFHRQRYKKVWAIKGDKNNNFFHHSIVKRARQNNITYLINVYRFSCTTPQQLESTFHSYFIDIFQAQGHPSNHLNDRVATTTPTQEQIADLTDSISDLQKLHTIIKGMRSNAAPGPDGLSAGFYKASWDWLKDDIQKVVKDFYCSAILPSDMNNTFIALIPKNTTPTVPQDFRPINLCNVIYKIIVKSLADILKKRLPDIIHPTQFSFVQDRCISNNIIITQEIIHSFNLKT
jgi:hypothetical protein